MWQLGLTSGESYPERPGVPNCVYYMRTGFCGYGGRCRYNHPRDRAAVVAAVRATGDYPERVGESVCQYYLKTGTCKFGASCKFHHPKHGAGSLNRAPLNIYGYPLRPGENECSYYLKTGQCKFGITCKFHHPQPAGTTIPASAPQFYLSVQSPVPLAEQYGEASTSLRVARPPLLTGSYVQGTYGPVLIPPGVVPIQGWSPYSAPLSPVPSPGAQPTVGATSLYGVTQLSSPTHGLASPYTSIPSSVGPSSSNPSEQVFPERPGELECQYYLKTGDCKYGPSWSATVYYLQNGQCKFGSTCKFDHPVQTMRYNLSASSLVDMPVVQYPVGSLLATLDPSSSSSDLRPELLPASKKDTYSTRVPSAGNTSSSSGGLIFSQSGSVSPSDVQLSSQTSSPLSNSRSTRPGGAFRRSI